MTIPAGLSIIFPQALATDPYTADLLIGDGGDSSTTGGGSVVKIFADGSGGGTGKPDQWSPIRLDWLLIRQRIFISSMETLKR